MTKGWKTKTHSKHKTNIKRWKNKQKQKQKNGDRFNILEDSFRELCSSRKTTVCSVTSESSQSISRHISSINDPSVLLNISPSVPPL